MTTEQLIAIHDAIRAARAETLACLVAFNAYGENNPGILRDEDAERLANAIGVHDVALELLFPAIEKSAFTNLDL